VSVTRRDWSKAQRFEALRYVPARVDFGRLLSARGHWSNADVYGDVPDSWAASPGVTLTLWGLNGQARVPLATAAISSLVAGSVGGRTYFVGPSVRGRPADGYDVTMQNGAVGALASGYVWLECWGTESTPETLGEKVGDNAANGAYPIRDARLSYWNPLARSGAGGWTRVQGDNAGRLKVIAVPERLADGGLGKSTSRTNAVVAVPFGCSLRQVSMTNNDAALVRYLQIHDKATVPVAGDVPIMGYPIQPIALTTARDCVLTFREEWYLYNGLSFACSTTPDVYTVPGAATGWFQWIAKQ